MIRRRLIERARAASIVLVSGPAGAGKTTLAEQVLGEIDAAATRLRAPMQTVDVEGPLLIDDVQLLAPPVAASWVEAIERRHGLTIVCGRRLGPFESLARRSDACLITWDDLAFSIEELRDALGEIATDSLVRDLADTTIGWPIVVDQALQRMHADPQWTPSARNGVPALLVDLIGDDSELATLARLPLLDDEIAGSEAIERLPLRRVGRWRALPPVIATALDRGRGVPIDVATRAANRYVEFGEIEAASRVLISECSPEDAVAVLARVHDTSLRELDVWQLRELVTHVHGVRSADSASFLLAASRAAERADRTSWGTWLEDAGRLVDDNNALHRAIDVDRARHQLRSGDVGGGAELARRLLIGIPPSEPITRGRALVVVAMAEVYECTMSSLTEAARHFREAATLFGRGREWALRADALARLGYTALFMAGRPAEGQQAMEAALALLPAGDWMRAYWLTNYSDVLEFLGRDVEADAVAREAIEIGERLRDEAVLGMAWWQRSWMASNRGDVAGFRRAVAEVEHHGGDWLKDAQMVEFLASTAERFLWLGEMSGYETMMTRAMAEGERTGFDESVRLVQASFDALEGDAAVGRDALAALEGTAGVVPVNRTSRLLLIAIAELRLGNDDGASIAVKEAFNLAAEMGVPDLNTRLHGGLLERLVSVTHASGSESSAMHLRMLGGFSLRGVDGGNRTPQPGHPATLVKLLALSGTITTDMAIDRLWPEADTATGRARLRNLLNRLKQRTGTSIVRDGDTLRLADDVEVDIVSFERATADALSAPAEERAGRARQALAMYTGELLPGDAYEDWATAHRARLQRRVVSLADIIADDAESRGDANEAARLLDLALEIEPLDETRTIRLCEILGSTGRSASAAKVAQRLIELLAELGVEPSAALARYARPAG